MNKVRKNGRFRLGRSLILLATVALGLMNSGQAQQSAPVGIAEMISKFNLENNVVGGEPGDGSVTEDDYGISQFDKAKTQFDGVTSEMQVTYLKLNNDQGVEIPILSTGKKNTNLDFTVMFYFKIDKDIFSRTVSEGGDGARSNGPPQIMYLFSFEDSVACFLTDTLTLMCDSWDRKKLQIPAGHITPGIWYHLTLSSSADGDSYLLVQNSQQVVGEDSQKSFGFRQNVLYGWKACIGDCNANFGFIGGIRELVMLGRKISKEDATRAKNLILTYDHTIKAYFRFQDLHNKFEKDEFVDWPWLTFKNKPAEGLESSYLGADIIPNDVCPSVFDQIPALRFTNENRLNDYELSEQLEQAKYSYTMSMTIMINETACTAMTPADAVKDCNLVELDGVFMLYLMGRNTARFHFFASKNYHESASKMIFIPYDQWITIQISIERFDGYSIVVSDQNGNAFFRDREDQNMQEQWPGNTLKLFRAFDGYVEHFYFTNSYKSLNPYFATDFRDEPDSLINIYFTKDKFAADSKLFNNQGRNRGGFELLGATPIFQDVFFQVPQEGGNVDGTLADQESVFDGIACNDRHMTTQLNSDQSMISFMTPILSDWSSANTIEFWFKIGDTAVYNQNVLLFSMVSNENNPQLYYHIYIQNGDLKCAPFGNDSFKDPIITFTEFDLTNQDTYGWWHVSCSYQFQQKAKGTLYNTKVFQQLEETMVGLPKFYPTNSLLSSFGKQPSELVSLPGASNVLVKEFRFWNKQQSNAELSNNRYRQIDPTKLSEGELLVYLRLATGSSLIENFASKNPFYTFNGFDLSLNDLSFKEDFIETEKYSYDKALDLVVSQKMRTYHTVCPVHTYYMDQYCYKEPVNQAVLAIFPQWNPQSLRLDWEMTLVYSSVINQDVIQFLKDSWASDDPILNDFLSQEENSLDHLVPSTILRHESEYKVTASLSNDELTFLKSASINFNPSKCKWLTVSEFGVNEGYSVLEISPGNEDIKIQLELKRNPELDCTQFDFFDTFSGLDFDFLMTSTADYISYYPKMEIVAYDAVTNTTLNIGDPTPEFMLINITMPMSEQVKLPVFQDIMILMTVHWSSSNSPDLQLTEDIVFQNLLYTIKFEPIANTLNADLVASQKDVIRGETLILDASNSLISNMPIAMQRRSLAYDWECPQIFQSYCDKQAGDQVAIPFDVAKESNVEMETPYDFFVTVIWAKPDGSAETKTLNATATWYDLAMPDFTIDFDPSQTLITSDANSLFYLEALNFAIDDIYEYEVEWGIEPELENADNRSVLSGGRVMQVIKGSYSKNTAYAVSCTVTHKKLDKLSTTRTVEFKTLAPPVGGSVQVSPLQGFVGDEFTIILQDWTSANLPIEYNVYSTFDTNGNRKGLLINQDGPVPVNEEFSFLAERTTPVIVSVFDASGETLEYTLNPQINLAPEPTPAEQNGPESSDPSNLQKDDQSGDSTSQDDAQTPPSPQQLLIQIQQQSSLRSRVNYMNVAIETVQKQDFQDQSKDEIAEQVNFRKQLIDEMQKQVIEFSNRDTQDPLYMPARDFLMESFQMLAQLTAKPQYLDQDIIDKCTQVVYRMTELQNNIFHLVLESEAGAFRSNFFMTLENLNKYARINSVEWTLQWVRHQLEQIMDLMCTWVDLPETYEYSSSLEELGFSLFKFDQQTALKSQRGTLRALDAFYSYNAFAMYNWFTASQPGALCAQVYAQQFGTVLMRGAYINNSVGRLSVTIYEVGTATRHTMGELQGQTVATFDLDRDTFHSNQTVCMGYAKQAERWKYDLCQSALDIENVQMKCECNAFESNMIGIFTDFTRTLGEPIGFPALPEPVVQELVVVPTKVDPTLSNSQTGKVTIEEINNLSGTNYVWMGQTILIGILTLAGSLVARKLDSKDEKDHTVSRTGPIPVAKQNHFINEVANELKEPYASVCYRKQSVVYYRTIFSKSAFPHLLSQLHPLLSPFTSYYATQGRLLRFSMYMLQVNIISAFIFLYYSAVYRQDDTKRNQAVIEQTDIVSVILWTVICSLLMTPWLSEPLIKTCSNSLQASADPNSANITQPVLLRIRRKGIRVVLMVMSFVTSLALPVWAITASVDVPASAQYCIATTVIGSIFMATLGTNMLYLWLNSHLARKVAYAPIKNKFTISQLLTHFRALQIVRDMKAVNEIKDQFTLADVLPSSLECSERSVCSHHSVQHNNSRHQNSQNISGHFKQLPQPLNEKTINDEEVHQEELIDEIENRMTLEVIREESKGAGGNNMITDAHENSQRALHKHQPSFDMNEDSQKHMLASMLKDSMLDFDNSRNDVVPQRTQLDHDQFAAVHPEGVNAGGSQTSGSSIEPSDSFQSDEINRSKLHRGPQRNYMEREANNKSEDNEARQVSGGKHRIRSANTNNSDIPLTIQPKVILQ